MNGSVPVYVIEQTSVSLVILVNLAKDLDQERLCIGSLCENPTSCSTIDSSVIPMIKSTKIIEQDAEPRNILRLSFLD